MTTTTTMMKARVLLLLGSLCLFAPLAQAFLAPSLHMATAAVTRRPAAMAAGSSLRMQAAAATGVDVPKISFSKYHGIGNDFILIDNRQSEKPILSAEQCKEICSRHYSIGADGVIFAMPGREGADYSMRIYNSDGSEPEMCGNGIRCLAKFLRQLEGDDKNGESRSYRIWTLAGVVVPVVRGDGLVTVDMGTPILEGAKVPTTLPAGPDGRVIEAPLEVAGKTWGITTVSMGNPHAIIFVPFLDPVDLAKVGPQFELHPVFPKKTNVEFVQVVAPNLLRMKVWERGAGPTLACGTGACALTVAAILAGKTDKREVTVQLPGGDLQIEWRKSDDHVYMTGAAELVYGGTIGALGK